MKLRTLIVDDEPIALEKLKNYVDKEPFLMLVGSCSSGLEAADFLLRNSVDVIFTDIQMPDLNGLEMIASLDNPPKVVFITAYADYAVESYRLSAVDYLLKPYGFNDFHRAATKIFSLFDRHRNDCHESPVACGNDSLFIKTDYRFVRVELKDIIFIKGFGEYLQIYISNNKTPLLTLSSFNSIRQSLSENFIQIHRSYIVNMNLVYQIVRGHVIMNDGAEIPIGDSYKDSVNGYLSTRSIGNIRKK